MKEEMTKEEVLDMVACADINLDNLAEAVPGLKHNPYWKIVKYQLGEALGEERTELMESSAS